MKTNEYEVNILHFVLKLIASLIVLMMIWASIDILVSDAIDDAKYDSTSFRLEMMDQDFYDRDFDSIFDTLTLYDLTSEEYDQYWELIDGYQDYLRCKAWCKCGDSELFADAPARAEEYRKKVQENASSCEFERNRRVFLGYEEEVAGM